MQLEHTFTVPADVEQAWLVLLDIERIAPCMPGAAIETVDGDSFTGSVKVRLGPIGLTYKGKASFVEKDEQAHRVVIDAQGKDARGNGTASAKVTATLTQQGNDTQVTVLTDLNITGKPAQFGRGVMVDVGNKLIGQFAECLAGKLTREQDEPARVEPAPVEVAPDEVAPVEVVPDASPMDQPTPAAAEIAAGTPVDTLPAEAGSSTAVEAGSVPAGAARPTGPRPAHAARPHEVEPIDLLGSAGPAVAKRLAPLAVLLALIVVIVVRRRR
ncbi:MAG: SRPBCC domain-containing protein [Jatrophihabitans sp.]